MAKVSLIAVTLFTAVAVLLSIQAGQFPDFFLFRVGSERALRGENPYDIATVRALVAVEFPEEKPTPNSFVNNCGYFLPPQAIVLFMPFALVPFPIAKIMWALLHGLAALAIVQLPQRLRSRDEQPPAPNLITQFVPFFLFFNFFTLAIVSKGQFTVVMVGCIAAGLWCFERRGTKNFWLGVVLWSVAFVKPHVALPLIPLAWYLYGWQRAVALVAVVAVLNLLGATIVGGSPLFLRDYFAYLSATFREVLYNRVDLNYEMASWNRLLFVATGVLIEQTAVTRIASYLVWFGLVVGRCGLAGKKPSVAWATGAAATGAVFCPQVLGYEILMLLLAVPWIRELFANDRRTWGVAAVVLLGLQAISFQLFQQVGIEFHRPLGVATFALLVLLGPISGERRGVSPPVVG